ncbi:molybdopterin molybdotransferase MoeA [Planobispora siamensis]|uniref:Molybdopterin molybdenumtransferase n=1 Tax=Planobispora siamensis TaxID=936338 RepID=A0A8J3S800_9ACTN|nr:molybdopterin molybdotransferase MoeA [Planobispora siamensis]GIH89951.1 molybdopterin molybdenumtransferase MoeA [Planobispora siamensis]
MISDTAVGDSGPDEDFHDLPWQRARERAHAAARPVPPIVAELDRAAGLTLAEEITARTPAPAFDTSAMDGFAVAGPGSWQVCGAVRAGTVWTRGALEAGQAVEISTGAPVPPGADAVLPVELAVRHADLVSGPQPAKGRHIRLAGEDAPAGALLAAAGGWVGPALLGLAASCGYDTLRVRPRPRVRILVTGDELVRHGLPGPGQVRDALGPMLPSLVESMGGRAEEVRHVPDRPEGSLAAAVEAAGEAEVIVVTGSTSVGVTDQLRSLLDDRAARWVVDTVACRPGHPQLLAGLDGGPWVVGLPGNPYAALVAAHTLLGPLLAGLSGRGLPVLPRVPLAGDVRVAVGRTRVLPATWDGAVARVLAERGSAFLNGAASGDALAAVPPDWTPGDAVPLVLLARPF